MRARLILALGGALTLAIVLFDTVTGSSRHGRSRSRSRDDDLRTLGLDTEDWIEFKRAMQHEGTGRRTDRFLDKARRGEPFTVAVVGGSVSKGRGLVESAPPPPVVPMRKHRRSEVWTEEPAGASSAVSQSEDGAEASHARIHARAFDGGSGAEDIFDMHGTSPHTGLAMAPPLSPFGSAAAARSTYGARTLYSPENMHMQIFNWLNATFPHKDNRLVNGAQGGVGAQYFAWCYEEHIPVDADLILLELGINDFFSVEAVAVYEQLVRRLLQLESKPAIINIETFTTLFPTLMSASSLHADIAAYYDFPSLSIRDNLLPLITRDPGMELPKWFRTGSKLTIDDPKVQQWGGKMVDLLHISAAGHSLAADLVIMYLQRQLDGPRHRPSRHQTARAYQDLQLPTTMLSARFDPLMRIQTRNRICRSMNSAHTHAAHETDNHANIAGGIRGVRLDEGSKGWTQMNWKEKRYLASNKPGSILHYTFVTPVASAGSAPTGSIALGFQRSSSLGFGAVSCWVDNERDKAKRLDGYWDIVDRNMGVLEEVRTDLLDGEHTLHCELLAKGHDPASHEFRIFAIAHD